MMTLITIIKGSERVYTPEGEEGIAMDTVPMDHPIVEGALVQLYEDRRREVGPPVPLVL